jgi:hypothetical protein
MRVSTVSGVVILAGTSGAYFGAAPDVLAGVCASVVGVTRAIVATNAAPRTLLVILIFLVSPCLNEDARARQPPRLGDACQGGRLSAIK